MRGDADTDDEVDADRRARWARALVENVTREYPHKPGYVLSGPEDLRRPRDVHPAFYGSFDWHSAVHSHWSLIRLCRLKLPPDLETSIRDVLGAHLSDGALAAEGAFLAADPLFERPYGWAWVMALATEVARWETADEVVDRGAVERLASTVCRLLVDHLETTRYPVRTGTHSSTAFALVFAHHHAVETGNAGLERSVERRGLRWFGDDPEASVPREPSGEDFLSPTLTTAHLMARLLDQERFVAWIDRVMPPVRQGGTLPLAEVPEIGDRADAKLVHLRGLALSRAWSWRAIADALPEDDPRAGRAREVASRLVEAVVDDVVSGDYGGDHWLVSFALLAAEGL